MGGSIGNDHNSISYSTCFIFIFAKAFCCGAIFFIDAPILKPKRLSSSFSKESFLNSLRISLSKSSGDSALFGLFLGLKKNAFVNV